MSDWHGVVLPASVCERLEMVERAMQAALADRTAPAFRVLLWGAPGVGKTEIRRAFARHGGLHAIVVGPDDLTGPYIGQAGARVKALFDRARAAEPTLLSIDMFEQYFERRNRADRVAQSSERIAAMLTEIDEQRSRARVFIVGETFEPPLVDEAILERGFEVIKIPMPDEAARAEILRQAFRKVPLASDFDLDETAGELAALLRGCPGRDLVRLVQRSLQRAEEQAFEQGGDPADTVLTRDLVLADEAVRAAGAPH